MSVDKIKFQGDELLLVNDSICTEDQFKNGFSAYAYLEDDKIMRHYKVIGTKDDIEFLGEVQIELSLEDLVIALANMIEGTGWSHKYE